MCEKVNVHLAKGCMICGDPVPIYEYECSSPVICDKCREAVLHVRRELAKENIKRRVNNGEKT